MVRTCLWQARRGVVAGQEECNLVALRAARRCHVHHLLVSRAAAPLVPYACSAAQFKPDPPTHYTM